MFHFFESHGLYEKILKTSKGQLCNKFPHSQRKWILLLLYLHRIKKDILNYKVMRLLARNIGLMIFRLQKILPASIPLQLGPSVAKERINTAGTTVYSSQKKETIKPEKKKNYVQTIF